MISERFPLSTCCSFPFFLAFFQLSYFQISRLEYKPKLPSVFFQPFTLAGMDITAVISTNPALVQRIFPLTHNLRAIDIVPVQQLMDADPWTTTLPPSSFLFRFWRPTPRYHHASFLGSCSTPFSSVPPCVPSIAASPTRSEGTSEGAHHCSSRLEGDAHIGEAPPSSRSVDGRAVGCSTARGRNISRVDADEEESVRRGRGTEEDKRKGDVSSSSTGGASHAERNTHSSRNDGTARTRGTKDRGHIEKEVKQGEGGEGEDGGRGRNVGDHDASTGLGGSRVTGTGRGEGGGGLLGSGVIGPECPEPARSRPGQGLGEKKGEGGQSQPPKFLGVHGGGLALTADTGLEAAVSHERRTRRHSWVPTTSFVSLRTDTSLVWCTRVYVLKNLFRT